jgi:hypothetical protein
MEGLSTIYYINSENRISGTTDNFLYDIQIPEVENYDRVTVVQANIPISYYIIQAGFNTFRLQEGATIVTVTIPEGNYSANSFIVVVLPLINLASPNGWTYTMSIPNGFTSTSTRKFTFTVTLNSSQPSFLFTTNVYEVFGFSRNSTNTFISNTLISSNIVKFIPEDSLFIHSDIVDNGDNSVLQEIFSDNNAPFSNIVYLCPDIECYSRKLRTDKSNTYSFSLTDENGRSINLNGLNMVFTIVLYKKDNFTTIFKNYLKYNLQLQN